MGRKNFFFDRGEYFFKWGKIPGLIFSLIRGENGGKKIFEVYKVGKIKNLKIFEE